MLLNNKICEMYVDGESNKLFIGTFTGEEIMNNLDSNGGFIGVSYFINNSPIYFTKEEFFRFDDEEIYSHLDKDSIYTIVVDDGELIAKKIDKCVNCCQPGYAKEDLISLYPVFMELVKTKAL